jgi:hypothetical protein
MKTKTPNDDVDFDPQSHAARELGLHIDDINEYAKSCFEGRTFAEEFSRRLDEKVAADAELAKVSARREAVRKNLVAKLIYQLKICIESTGKSKTDNRRRLKKS